MKQITKLFQPVKFKRNEKSEWERGIKQIDNTGIKIIDYKENVIEDVYKYEVDWFLKM